MRERPVSVMIFGILNIAFALFGLLGLLVGMLFMSHMGTASNPFLQQLNSSPAYQEWMKISGPMNGIVSIFLLASGIGLLLLRNWGRILSICYGIYGILAAAVGGAVMILAFSSVLMRIFSIFGVMFGLIYPVLLLIFMTRPKIVAAFQPTQPAT